MFVYLCSNNFVVLPLNVKCTVGPEARTCCFLHVFWQRVRGQWRKVAEKERKVAYINNECTEFMWTFSEYAVGREVVPISARYELHRKGCELAAYALDCVRVCAVWLGTNVLCWFVLSVFTARLILQFLKCPDFLLLSTLNEFENGNHTIPPSFVLIKRLFPSGLGSSHVFRIVRHWIVKT